MKDQEPTDLVGRAHRFFGMKPSEEEIAKTERIRIEGEAANAELKKAFDADLERRRRGLQSESARRLQAAEEVLRDAEDRLAHMPEVIGRETDDNIMLEVVRSGKRLTKEIIEGAHINQWNDGYGNIIYLNGGADPEQIHTISARITEQRGAFDTLGTEDQVGIRAQFSSSQGLAESTQPYRDFLHSEALGQRFEELKSNPESLREVAPFVDLVNQVIN